MFLFVILQWNDPARLSWMGIYLTAILIALLTLGITCKTSLAHHFKRSLHDHAYPGIARCMFAIHNYALLSALHKATT